jgi:hypothetical protein
MPKSINLKDKDGDVYLTSQVYSTKEQKVGWWENDDGTKVPLYRKVVEYKTTGAVGEADKETVLTIPHNITNLKQCIKIDAFTGDYRLPVTAGASAQTYTGVARVIADSIKLVIANDKWGSGRTWTFILEYTKTTD